MIFLKCQLNSLFSLYYQMQQIQCYLITKTILFNIIFIYAIIISIRADHEKLKIIRN